MHPQLDLDLLKNNTLGSTTDSSLCNFRVDLQIKGH